MTKAMGQSQRYARSRELGIGGELDAPVSHTAPDIAHEGLGVLAGALANQERRNQFGVCVQGDENPLIAKLCRIVLVDVSRFLHQEGPDFIALNTAAEKFPHFFVHQLLAALSSQAQSMTSIRRDRKKLLEEKAAIERAIRRTLELAFLNHHVRNALTQMTMVSYIADPEKQEHLLQDAASRVSEVLFRIANSADLTGLSLEVDLAGAELAHAGEAREQGEGKKAS